MSHYLAQNIKYLRKQKGFTQEDLAQKIGVNRAALGSYEEGRAEPRLQVLQNLAHYFSIGLDDLLNRPLSESVAIKSSDKHGKSLRVLSVAVDKETGNERMVVVPVKAAAGYLDGFSDIDFIESLPSFTLPIQELGRERTYRLFQIKGDSMHPIPDGSYIITEYIQNWTNIRDNHCYVLITRDEGVVYKRVLNRLDEDMLILKSDNPDYKPYSVSVEYLAEVWKAVGYICLQLPDSDRPSFSPNDIMQALIRIEQDVKDIKKSNTL